MGSIKKPITVYRKMREDGTYKHTKVSMGERNYGIVMLVFSMQLSYNALVKR